MWAIQVIFFRTHISLLLFPGISDPSGISDDCNFKQLGADSLVINEIQQILGREYNIALKAAEVEEMTYEKLKELAE